MKTIHDVARLAAVSTATVSRVLSQPEKVRPTTRERVQAAIDQLGYEANRAARSLRTLRAAKLLVTVPDISNPFFGNIIRGAEDAARAAGLAIVIGDTGNDPVLEEQYAAFLRRREVDGLVFLGHRLPATLAPMVAIGDGRAPIVNACEFSPDLNVSSVHIDNTQAGSDVADHLIALGHRRIGIVTGPLSSPLSRDRLAGVDAVMRRHGIADDTIVTHGDFDVDSGLACGRTLVRTGVSAIFCFSDEMAMGVLEAIREAGLSCPGDVSVVGFDDIRFARHLAPPLTTVAQPAFEIGKAAIEMLIRAVNGDTVGQERLVLPHRLIVRDSTGPRNPAR